MTTGKRGLFNYLEGYRQLFLPYKTNNEWLKTNTKAYIVEAKSDVPEAKASGRSRKARASTLSVCTTRLLQMVGTQGHAPALLTMTEKGVYAISLICLPSLWELMIVTAWMLITRVRTDTD